MCLEIEAAALLQVRKQPNGKLTVVIQGKDGRATEIPDNDQVLMATGESRTRRGLTEANQGWSFLMWERLINLAISETWKSSKGSFWNAHLSAKYWTMLQELYKV